MHSLYSVIRKLTVPPVFAALLLLLLYSVYPEYFASFWNLLASLLLLCILPLLAYPLQKHIPRFKDRGREGQRSLAIHFSAAAYILGTAVAWLFNVPAELKLIYHEYLLCGVIMLIVNKAFKVKASGHACGIIGPILLLSYFKLLIPAAISLLLVIPVYISSIKTKQHSLPQLLGGSIIPFFVLFSLHLFF
ncbi:MAG: hypothetical protein Q4B50_08625 [Bacillota bacterium]|nr:hypothetical protein [Bacillota bacterium]